MRLFTQRLRQAIPSHNDIRERQWIYVPYDRLTDRTGPLAAHPPEQTGIVMMEALAKAHRRAYHKKKLALLIANQRHFALEQAARGVKVLYLFTNGIFADGLLEAQKKHHIAELVTMKPAERELRLDLEEARKRGVRIEEVPDSTWLSSEADFDEVYGPQTTSFLMDRFYRSMRKKTNTLMEDGEPAGGKYSYDSENRKPWRGKPPVPRRPSYEPDEITQEVLEMVAREFPNHFGTLDGFDLPATAGHCQQSWNFALEHLLPLFGPFEDAMAAAEPDLFHSKVSAIMNLSRILPAETVRGVEDACRAGKISLASAEGFIRQVLGWREFMRHVHRRTDGYRALPGDQLQDQLSQRRVNSYIGAAPSALDAKLPLPAVYWGSPSGMNCVDTVIAQVIREGWSHHITRLMVLSNLATLCGFSPRELADWFWIAYIDAYDWVVEPNVLGMGTYSDGGVTSTKPYVSGAAYIDRMSDYCKGCALNPKKSTGEGACPFTALYWNFLERNAETLSGNFRLAMPFMSLRKKSSKEREQLRAHADQTIRELSQARYPSAQTTAASS
jgi:deoxyribodipyrimidine photolyase-related protein